jgi:hypothetical protein
VVLANDTKQAEIKYRQRQYAVPPVEFAWKGEYEPNACGAKNNKRATAIR